MQYRDIRLSETQVCRVKLPFFEGPLDLLLYLVRRSEVNIKEIKVAEICDQYLGYLGVMEMLNLDLAGDFLVMAATLIRLKANELVPRDSAEQIIIDGAVVDRDALIRQIQEYSRFKMAAGELRKLESETLGTFFRGRAEYPEFSAEDFLNSSEAKVFDLLLAFQNIVNRKAKQEGFYLDKVVYHIDDQIEWILGLLAEKVRLEFIALFAEDDNRAKMITTFLALLELVRIGKVSILQHEPFGPIWIEPRAETADRDQEQDQDLPEPAAEAPASEAPAAVPSPPEVQVVVEYNDTKNQPE